MDEDGSPWHKDKLRIPRRLNTGAKAAHFCIPFQCECCWMLNLEGRPPGPLDTAYLRALRHANLDAMSGKARSTITGHRRCTVKLVRNALRANKSPSLQLGAHFL